MREYWKDKRARMFSPETLAYHEAGHAVVAYECGLWVQRGGVRISAWESKKGNQIGQACLYGPDAMHTSICIDMAGLLSEEKFHGQQWGWEADVINHLRAVGIGQDEVSPFPFPTDLRADAI